MRVELEQWSEIKRIAAARRQTVSEVVREAIDREIGLDAADELQEREAKFQRQREHARARQLVT